MEFLDISSLGAIYRYATNIEQKIKQKMWLSICESKAGKEYPQRIEQRIEPRWSDLGQPIESASK